jgi:hypothetical protein
MIEVLLGIKGVLIDYQLEVWGKRKPFLPVTKQLAVDEKCRPAEPLGFPSFFLYTSSHPSPLKADLAKATALTKTLLSSSEKQADMVGLSASPLPQFGELNQESRPRA